MPGLWILLAFQRWIIWIFSVVYPVCTGLPNSGYNTGQFIDEIKVLQQIQTYKFLKSRYNTGQCDVQVNREFDKEKAVVRDCAQIGTVNSKKAFCT